MTIKSQPKKKPEIKAPSQPTKPERQTRVIAEKEQNDLPKNKTEPKTLKRPKSKKNSSRETTDSLESLWSLIERRKVKFLSESQIVKDLFSTVV